MPGTGRHARSARAAAFVLMLMLFAACGRPDADADRSTGGLVPEQSPTSEATPSVVPVPPPSHTSRTPTARGGSRALPWGPTQAEWEHAQQVVAHMSAAEKAGQVIVAGYPGTNAPLALVRRYHVGGVIVMGDNAADVRQVRRVNLALQAEVRRQGRDWPLMIGVDQEGGTVARVKTTLTEFPSYMTLGAARDARLARDVARASGNELRALGFTMVFAPDADVTSGPADPTIGSRSAGSDPHVVAAIVKGSLRGYGEAGIVAVPKHFPGHGSVSADSHMTLPVQRETLAELAASDLVPFKAAIAAGAEAMMVAHIDVRSLDPGTPSSLSHKVIGGLLRQRLGFAGVTVTDALEMAGASGKYGSAEAGVRALLAGADVLLLPSDAGALHGAILRALQSGRLPQARLDEAATRSVALMLHQAASAKVAAKAAPGAAIEAGNSVARAESLRGLTVVSGPCKGRLVGPKVRVVGGLAKDRSRFTAAARAAGLEVGADGDVVRLLGRGSPGQAGAVVVSLDTPYALGRSKARTARIALYGRTPTAFRALVDVLTGRAHGTGRLPVRVAGVGPGTGCSPPR